MESHLERLENAFGTPHQDNRIFTKDEESALSKLSKFSLKHAHEQLKTTMQYVGQHYRSVERDGGKVLYIKILGVDMDYSHDLLTKGFNSEERAVFVRSVVVDSHGINILKHIPSMTAYASTHLYESIPAEEFDTQYAKTLETLMFTAHGSHSSSEAEVAKSALDKMFQLIGAVADKLDNQKE